MKTIVISFTDSYGMEHSAAVLEVAHGAYSSTAYETIGDHVSSSTSISVAAQYRYWHSQAARDAGALPMAFMLHSGDSNFSSQPAVPVSDIEGYCLSYFVEALLPQVGGSLVADAS